MDPSEERAITSTTESDCESEHEGAAEPSAINNATAGFDLRRFVFSEVAFLLRELSQMDMPPLFLQLSFPTLLVQATFDSELLEGRDPDESAVGVRPDEEDEEPVLGMRA
jgi:hypothetical protein